MFYTYVFHFTSFSISSSTKPTCHIPWKGPHIGDVKGMCSLPAAGKKRMTNVWRRCHNAPNTGWHVHIISDHSWCPLPVLGRIDPPGMQIVAVDHDLNLLTFCVWHVLLNVVMSKTICEWHTIFLYLHKHRNCIFYLHTVNKCSLMEYITVVHHGCIQEYHFFTYIL